MLQVPQERVGGGELVEIATRDMTLVVELLQRKQGTPGTQPGLGATVHALQALHQKLDIANAAAIDLYIQTLLPFSGYLLAPFAVNFFPCFQGGLCGGEVDFFPIDLRLVLPDELPRQRFITRPVADLNERLPLPVVFADGVVLEGMRQIDRQLSFVALRP